MQTVAHRPLLVLAGLVLALHPPLGAATRTVPLNQGWQLRSSVLVPQDGAALTADDFQPRDWHPVTVPTTVLTALVKAGLYPDPTVGLNNLQIPDASEAFTRAQLPGATSHLPDGRNPWQAPYWFWTRFRGPGGLSPERRIALHLEGIQYRADVWLNGHRVAQARDLVGQFADWELPVTPWLHAGGTNTLALCVYPLDVPGEPAAPQLHAFGPFEENGGPTGDIGRNVTMHCGVGWDWIPAVRDRNLGLWRPVSLDIRGPVALRPPQVITTLAADGRRAAVTCRIDLVNNSDTVQRAVCRLRITPPGSDTAAWTLTRGVQVDPHQTRTLQFDPRTDPDLDLDRPALWWPHGYGDQPLYGLDARVRVADEVSDRWTGRFGVRTVDSRVTQVDGWARRDFFVNGHRVSLRGGAWVPDLLLSRDETRLRHELRLHREANLNLVRIWGGGLTPPPAFFDLCDELGLLVWHDFWITGDCQGTWGKGSKDYPPDADVFLRHAHRVVERYRHHPSLLLWSAGNEGYPRAEIYVPLRQQLVAELDGSRPFIPSSGFKEPPGPWGLSWPDNGPAGTYSGGPYCWVDPCEYYRKVAAGQDWLFKNEVGIPSVPVLESLRRFIPDLTPDPNVPFPLNDTWGYHDACEGNGKYSLYDQALRRRYGEPRDVADYVAKAQLVNAESYRAMFEAVNQAPERTAGLILWKSAPAWPSVIWQLYDWYLCPHAGYYATRRACEPVHVQLNLDDHRLVAVNRRRESQQLTFTGTVLTPGGHVLWHDEQPLSLAPDSVTTLGTLPPDPQDRLRFLHLSLRDGRGQAVSENLRWLAADNDFQALADLPPARLESDARRDRSGTAASAVTVTLRNPGRTLAFFVRLRLTSGHHGEEILPSYWSDNYVSVLPGESRSLRVTPGEPADGPLAVRLDGWNVAEQTLPVSP